MNVKECYRQYVRGRRCAEKTGHKSLPIAQIDCDLRVPDKRSQESEYWSFIEGWNEVVSPRYRSKHERKT
jgi:hypothetical protein